MTEEGIVEIGDKFYNRYGTEYVVISYNGYKRVRIKFLDEFGYEYESTNRYIKIGLVSNPYDKCICGVGYIGEGPYPMSYIDKITGKKVSYKEYTSWLGMIHRCYDPKVLLIRPTYEGCTTHVDWHCYQTFAAWWNGHKRVGLENRALDKDILFPGNKIYGPATCAIVPAYLNNSLVLNTEERELPQGVTLRKYGYHMMVSSKTLKRNISKSNYETAMIAHQAWQQAKAALLESLIDKYVLEDDFNTKVACAMMSRVWKLRSDSLLGVETTKW